MKNPAGVNVLSLGRVDGDPHGRVEKSGLGEKWKRALFQPEPDVLAQEIAGDLQTAPEQFAAIAGELGDQMPSRALSSRNSG